MVMVETMKIHDEMIEAPPIEKIAVLDDFVLEVHFDGLPARYVDLKTFPLLGDAAKLRQDELFLRNFKLNEGIPKWGGEMLLSGLDLLQHSVSFEAFSRLGIIKDAVISLANMLESKLPSGRYKNLILNKLKEVALFSSIAFINKDQE